VFGFIQFLFLFVWCFVLFCGFARVSIGVVDSAAHAHPTLGAKPGQDGSQILCVLFFLVCFLFWWFSLFFVFGTISAPERRAPSPIWGPGPAKMIPIDFVFWCSLVFSLTMLCLEGLSLYILKHWAKLPAPGVFGLCTGDCIHNSSEDTTQKM
jgi:hypothetical protein